MDQGRTYALTLGLLLGQQTHQGQKGSLVTVEPEEDGSWHEPMGWRGEEEGKKRKECNARCVEE